MGQHFISLLLIDKNVTVYHKNIEILFFFKNKNILTEKSLCKLFNNLHLIDLSLYLKLKILLFRLLERFIPSQPSFGVIDSVRVLYIEHIFLTN